MNENLESTEIMSCEEEDEDMRENSGIGTGLAMVIGSGITVGIIAGVKGLKKLWNKRKAGKKEENTVEVIDSNEVIDNVFTDLKEKEKN